MLLASFVVRAEVPEVADPLAVDPGDYRAPLDPVAYHKAVTQLPKDRIDPRVAAESKFPDWAVLVVDVSEGMQGPMPTWSRVRSSTA